MAKIYYYGGSYGEWDDVPENEQVNEGEESTANAAKKNPKKSNKLLIGAALIAAALFLFG